MALYKSVYYYYYCEAWPVTHLGLVARVRRPRVDGDRDAPRHDGRHHAVAMVTAQVRGHVTSGRVVIEDKPVGAEQPVYLQSGSVNKSHQIYDNLDGLYSAGQREPVNQSVNHAF